VGDAVAEDEVVLEIETDKVGFYINHNPFSLYIFHSRSKKPIIRP
jgi:hypothetical protein